MKLASKPCVISSACGAPLRPAVASIASAHINRGADPETGIKMVALRSDLAPEQRAEALRIGRIGFTSAGAKRKPTEAIAALRKAAHGLVPARPAPPAFLK